MNPLSALAKLGSPTARQPLPCHSQAAHPAAHPSDTTSHIGQRERSRRKCELPHSPPAQLGPACHCSQEPGSTWGRKPRAHQGQVSPVLLPRKHPGTHAARESLEATTAQVNWAGRCRSQDKPPCAAHTSSQQRGDGCHTADQIYRGAAICRGLCLDYINRAATEETPHFSLTRQKPAQLSESQPEGWSHGGQEMLTMVRRC